MSANLEAPEPTAYPPVTLFDTQSHTISSTRVGIDYVLLIWLPPGYASEHKTYPVLYVLDDIFAFGLAWSIAPFIMFGKEIPDLIIVGIGNRIASWDDWIAHRNRDYDSIPNLDRPEEEGGAPLFLEFIETELAPYIESTFRADPNDRAIYGYSLGGHFVLYALMSRPMLFRRYVVGAPAMSQVFQARFHDAMAAARNGFSEPARLAILVGEADDSRPNVEAFWTLLKHRNYAGLDLKTFVLSGASHLSGGPQAILEGLKAVFN